MNASEATHVNTIILIVLAGSTMGLIMMLIWLIGFVRELSSELKAIRAELSASKVLVSRQEGREEIWALRAKESGEPLTHTDDRGP